MQHRLLFICLFPFFLLAQTPQEQIDFVLKMTPRNMEKYSKPAKKDLIFLETAFNNAIFTDKNLLNSVKDKVILKIELVYTTYRKSETFDQHGLSRKRLENLFLAAPNSLNQSGIEWVLIAQTGCRSAEEGKDFFHGFVITYRDLPDEVSTKVESNFLREVAAGKIKSYAYDTYLKRETEKLERDSMENVEPVIVLQNSRAVNRRESIIFRSISIFHLNPRNRLRWAFNSLSAKKERSQRSFFRIRLVLHLTKMRSVNLLKTCRTGLREH